MGLTQVNGGFYSRRGRAILAPRLAAALSTDNPPLFALATDNSLRFDDVHRRLPVDHTDAMCELSV